MKTFSKRSIILLLGLTLWACDNDDTRTINVKINEEPTTIAVNETYQLTVTGTPVTWRSTNETVAEVEENTGLVTGKSAGKVTIIATAQEDPTITDSIELTIVINPVTAVTLAIADNVDIANGTPTEPGLVKVERTLTRTLKVTVAPQEATDKEVEVTISEGAASITIVSQEVDANTGEITLVVQGIEPGEATLSAKALDGSEVTDQFKVQVTQDHFVTTWQGTEIALPVRVSKFEYDYKVDLNNDGIFDQEFNETNTGVHLLTFDDEGPHTIRISGKFPAINTSLSDQTTRDKIKSLDQWGTGEWLSMHSAFLGCSYLQVPATDVPDLSKVESMKSMFSGATAADPEVRQWNTSNVVDMGSMFSGATAAKPDVSQWNTSNVLYMDEMFRGAINAKPDVSQWNTAQVDDTSYMFSGAVAANPIVSQWNTQNVRFMGKMFEGATAAEPDVSQWDTSNVFDMEGMFKDAVKAEPDVSQWDVRKVVSVKEMFSGATLANPDMSLWNIPSVGTDDELTGSTEDTMQDMFKCSGISVQNYGKALNRFFDQVSANNTPQNIDLGDVPVAVAPGTDASNAKSNLVDNFGWQINDGTPCE